MFGVPTDLCYLGVMESLGDETTPPQTLLLVDDDKTIVMVIKKLLEEHGYRVLSATSAEEALRLFQRRSADISMVITDVVMPRMNGP
jgi:CheY-like chemotaxis protein